MSPENTSQAAEAWPKRFERFRTADMTVAQFCNAEGVSQASYYYWRRKLQGDPRATDNQSSNATPRFVPIALAHPSQSKPSTVMAVELPGGIRIRFEVAGNSRQEQV